MTAPTPSRPRRALATLAAVAALGAAGGLAGCGGPSKPSQQALAAKLKQDTRLQSFTNSQIDCVASTLRRYGNPSSLTKYVDGKITADQLQGSDQSTVQRQLAGCLHTQG